MTRVVRNGVTAERSGDVHPLRGRFSILWPSVMTRTALLIVDVQNDFASKDGSLYVGAGEQVVPLVNALRDRFVFDLVVLTQDYHPVGHVSFHSTHAKDPNAKLFEPYSLPNGQIQMLWPDHCVVGTHGSKFHPALEVLPSDTIVQKGVHIDADSYSGFMDNNRMYKSNLEDLLTSNKIDRVVVVGLAYDYCVGSTALDAKSAGFETIVCPDATKSVHPTSEQAMRGKLIDAGVQFTLSTAYPHIVSI
ncbi:nicotinamidase [Plasmodiophora brassicae]